MQAKLKALLLRLVFFENWLTVVGSAYMQAGDELSNYHKNGYDSDCTQDATLDSASCVDGYESDDTMLETWRSFDVNLAGVKCAPPELTDDDLHMAYMNVDD
jgi:hypothetical protein